MEMIAFFEGSDFQEESLEVLAKRAFLETTPSIIEGADFDTDHRAIHKMETKE